MSFSDQEAWTPYTGPPPQFHPHPWAPQSPPQPFPHPQPDLQQWVPAACPPPGRSPGWGGGSYPAQPPHLRRPGPVLASAVLAFASAALVLLGTVYAVAFSALLSLARGPGTGIGPGLTLLHLALAGLLVVAGLRVLARDRRWLLGVAVAQVALAVRWVVVLDDVLPPALGGGVMVPPLVFAALAAVAAGLTFLPDARAWTAEGTAGGTAGGG